MKRRTQKLRAMDAAEMGRLSGCNLQWVQNALVWAWIEVNMQTFVPRPRRDKSFLSSRS